MARSAATRRGPHEPRNAPGNGHRKGGRSPTELSIAEAIAKKEKYAGLLRKLEYEKATGQLCEIAVIETSVNEDYTIARNRLMGVGSKVVPLLLGTRDVEEMKRILDHAIDRALEGLDVNDVLADIRISMGDAAAPVADNEDEWSEA